MKKFNFFSVIIMVAGLITSSFVQGQSCDTLRNYDPSAPYYQFTSATGLILGHNEVDISGDTYQADAWAEPYTVSSATTVRALRVAPWKVQDNSGGGSITFQVFGDNAGTPSGVLGSQTVPIADFTQNTWKIIEFTTPVNVSAGNFHVGYILNYTTPADSFALLGTQPTTGVTKLRASGSGILNGQWSDLNALYTLETAFLLDVLTSTGTPPTANFTVSNASACVGGVFNVDGSTSTGTIDDYTWILREDNTIINNLVVQPDGTIVDQISPNTATPSQQRLVLFVSGACKTTGVYTVVDVLPEVDATVTKVDDNCTAGTKSISINATGGNNSYLYSINGGSSTQPNGNFSGLSAGTYNVVVTTVGDGCSYTESIVVGDTPLEDASFTYATNTICSGGLNVSPTNVATAGGTFSAVPTGLVFVNSSTGEIDMTNSVAGTYDVTYTISGTCGNSEVQSITITNSPDASFSYSATEFCQNEGAVMPTFPTGASGGTFTSTTGLTIASGTGSVDLASSTPGVYVVTNTIAASGSCAASSETFSITVKETPTVDAGADQAVCEGTDVTLTATGADTYAWDNGITQGTPFTPGVGTLIYTVTGTGVNGCENTDQVSVVVTANPTVNAGADQAVCEGAEVTLTAASTGGTVTWDNGVTDGTPFTPTTTTTYTVSVDNNGCTATDEVVVTVNPLPTVDAGADQTACTNHSAIALGGTPAGGTFSGNGVSNNEFDPATAGVGTHTVTYTYADGNGCENTATLTVTVDGCVSVEENVMNQLTVSPNPSSDYIEVRVNENNSIQNIQVMSLDGKVVSVEQNVVDHATIKIDVSSVAKGTYLIQLSTEYGFLTRKIVVQ